MTTPLFGGPADPVPAGDRTPTQMRVLITVKAAPNPSTAHGETVCVAGLRLDLGAEGWVRLYPINFRHIEGNGKFQKYDVVTVSVSPASEGRRESWKPKMQTLEVVGHLKDWDARMPYLEPHARDTMCDLNARSDNGPSLGLVEAHDIGLDIEPHPGWTKAEQAKIDAYMAQGELFDSGKPKSALEAPPFRAFYKWSCPAAGCKGHRQGIIDWELVAFMRHVRGGQDPRTEIRARWLDQLCSPSNDVYFYVGNQAKRRHVFSVLGVVYPRR